MRTLFYAALLVIMSSFKTVSANVAPEQVITTATDEVMVVITEAKTYYEKDPDRYFTNIASVLDKFVDFDDFSKAVMGGFASDQRLKSMKNEADKARTLEQIERFSAVFKAGLVQTYGKGFLAFGGEKVEISDSRLSPDGNDAQVLQLVYGIAEKPYEIRYSLRKNTDGDWKLRNVVIEGINLGKIYRNQFLSAARKYQGDVDQVIDNWVIEETAI
jgi:phospholipid transport system substrate-binding protein